MVLVVVLLSLLLIFINFFLNSLCQDFEKKIINNFESFMAQPSKMILKILRYFK